MIKLNRDSVIMCFRKLRCVEELYVKKDIDSHRFIAGSQLWNNLGWRAP